MHTQFWFDKWQEPQQGFQQETFHPALIKHFPKLEKDFSVLVPLCGKSKDMLWLVEQGYLVVGIELVESAVVDFFNENQFTYVRKEKGEIAIFRCNEKPLKIIAGDLFKLGESVLTFKSFDALYDRAALVAMPPEMRPEYVVHCRKFLKPEAKVLLISFLYDESAMQGPPFSISHEEIDRLWDSKLALIESFNMLKPGSKFFVKGMEYMVEETWLA